MKFGCVIISCILRELNRFGIVDFTFGTKQCMHINALFMYTTTY